MHEIVGYCVFVWCDCFAKLCVHLLISIDFYRPELNLELIYWRNGRFDCLFASGGLCRNVGLHVFACFEIWNFGLEVEFLELFDIVGFFFCPRGGERKGISHMHCIA